MQTKLDDERPVTADVLAKGPNNLVLPFTLSITPDTTANRTAVEKSLDDLILRDAAVGDGAGQGTIFLSQVYTAIGTTTGVDDFSVTLPAGNTVPSTGDLITRGAVTWV